VQLPYESLTSSATETEEIAKEFAALLEPADVIWVSGDLGAGKTAFVRGACRALGIDDPVTSPTFTIAQRYSGAKIDVSHMDLYRLADGLDGEIPGLLEEEVGPDRVTFVEWAERSNDGAQIFRYRVEIEHKGGDQRMVRIS